MKVWEALRDRFATSGEFTYGKVTGTPSTTVITDANAALTANTLAGGTLFLLKDTAGAAPEGEFQRIASNTATTITIDTALSVATAVGDTYAWTSPEFNPAALFIFVNDALDEIGRYGRKDTSITTASTQTEYTYPVALRKGTEPRGVYIQDRTGDANSNLWREIIDWHVEPSTPGNTALILIDQPIPSRTIKIEYIGIHDDVSAFDDEIDEAIHPKLMRSALNLIFANARADGALHSQRPFNLGWNKAQSKFEQAKSDFPMWMPEKRGKLMRIARRFRHRYVGDQDVVRQRRYW